MTRTRPAASAAAAAALLLTLLTGCGPGGSDPASSDSGGASSGSAGEQVTPEVADGPLSSRSAVGDAAARTPLERAVVATGEVRVETRRVERARDEALSLTRTWGGLVADEQTGSDGEGRPASSTLVLRVPTPRFATALEELADLGRVTEQTRSAEDVTTQVVDTRARVRAAERSIRSIESLLSRAERLGDVIRIESDLARRQADLDSLKQQQAYLADQTSLSTITLHLDRPSATPPPPAETRGFLAGLAGGWDAMAASGVVLATAVGAVLPFAALLALVGVPLARVLRRRRTATVTDPAAPAT